MLRKHILFYKYTKSLRFFPRNNYCGELSTFEHGKCKNALPRNLEFLFSLILSFKLKMKLLAAIKEQNQTLTPTLKEDFDL